MKLIAKLTAALIAGMVLVLAVNGYFRIRRETAALHADRARDHALIGRALASAVSAAWRSDGRAEALHILEAANGQEAAVRARWIDAKDVGDAHADPAALTSLPPGDTLTALVSSEAGDSRLSYTAVSIAGERLGFVELSEKLALEQRAARSILSDTFVTTVMLIMVSGALAGVLGVWLVGQPMNELCAKARRIGEGDFSHPLVVDGHDEIGVLAEEMNAACARLTEAAARVEQETAARIVALEQLRHAERLTTVGKLASGVAHELGTPLNVISARAKMIADGHTTPANTAEYAGIIANAADRMTKIIRQLLAFARRKATTKTARDITHIACDTAELVRPIAEKANVAFEIDDRDRAVMAAVDGGEIQQVLTNLFVNAIHAMPNGGAVHVSLARETRAAGEKRAGDYVVVRVRDEGTGIAPEDIPHIFEPFFTTKEVGQGTGLGLSISHGIAEDHGGFIDVTSEVGKGSTFAIYLPAPGAPS